MEIIYFVVVQIILSFLLSLLIYPNLLRVSREKGLLDEPNKRSAHNIRTPSIGGVGIFITFCLMTIITILTYGYFENILEIIPLCSSLLILFFTGLNDDMVSISAAKKTGIQLVSALLFLLYTDFLIEGFDGIFGVFEMPLWLSWVFTIFLFILGINAFNLIDGIDGLAGGLASFASFFFGIVFMFHGEVVWGFISFGLFAALMGFLRYNLSKDQKLFMGDNGSMVVGFMLIVLSIKFINTSHIFVFNSMNQAILCVIALFSYPLTDVARVFFVRLRSGRSPFEADKNHLHHYFLMFGVKHFQIMLLVLGYTIFILVITYVSFNFLNVHVSLLLITSINLLLGLVPSFLARSRDKTANKIYESTL